MKYSEREYILPTIGFSELGHPANEHVELCIDIIM